MAFDQDLAGQGDEVAVLEQFALGLEDAGLGFAQAAGGIVGQGGELLVGDEQGMMKQIGPPVERHG